MIVAHLVCILWSKNLNQISQLPQAGLSQTDIAHNNVTLALSRRIRTVHVVDPAISWLQGACIICKCVLGCPHGSPRLLVGMQVVQVTQSTLQDVPFACTMCHYMTCTRCIRFLCSPSADNDDLIERNSVSDRSGKLHKDRHPLVTAIQAQCHAMIAPFHCPLLYIPYSHMLFLTPCWSACACL